MNKARIRRIQITRPSIFSYILDEMFNKQQKSNNIKCDSVFKSLKSTAVAVGLGNVTDVAVTMNEMNIQMKKSRNRIEIVKKKEGSGQWQY